MPKAKFETIGIIAKRTMKEEAAVLKKLYRFLKKQKREIVLDTCAAPLLKKGRGMTRAAILEKANLVIVLGGDGTLLKTARCLSPRDVLVLGVNLGQLGFLTEVPKKEMLTAVRALLQGHRYVVDARSLLRVTLYRRKKKIHTSLALNDGVINQGSFARLIQLHIDIDHRKMASFEADGLIVASPTGSTAHALSAGGPIVHPKLPGLVIVPICPSSLSSRPIVIPHGKEVRIRIGTKRRAEHAKIGLTLDGQEMIPLQYDDEINIRKSSRTLCLVRLSGKRYYQVLREKLRWGEG